MRWLHRLVFVALCFPAASQATILERWSLDELVVRSDSILIGRVGPRQSVMVRGRLMTEIEIRVERSLVGKPEARFTLNQLGGKVPGRVTEVLGTARLAPGKRFLLFVHRSKEGRWFLVGMAQGAFLVSGDEPLLKQQIDVPMMEADGQIIPAPLDRRIRMDDLARSIQRVGR